MPNTPLHPAGSRWERSPLRKAIIASRICCPYRASAAEPPLVRCFTLVLPPAAAPASGPVACAISSGPPVGAVMRSELAISVFQIEEMKDEQDVRAFDAAIQCRMHTIGRALSPLHRYKIVIGGPMGE